MVTYWQSGIYKSYKPLPFIGLYSYDYLKKAMTRAALTFIRSYVLQTYHLI